MARTKLNTFVSIAEIIASLAIVVSLFYAVNEFQRTETLTNRDVENILYDRMLRLNQLIIENPDLSHIIIKATNTPDELTQQEKIRYLAFEHIFYDSWESAWYYFQEGVLEQVFWDSWDNWFKREAKIRPVLGWHGNRRHFSGDFLEYVDRQLGFEQTEQ